MSIVERPTAGLRRLVDGERMSQAEFHRRSEECPEGEKWELIGGTVYMASPLRLKHSRYDGEIGYLLETYGRATPGIEVTHNATAILGVESEPQPDLAMRILPEYGGQSRTTATDYLEGAPEGEKWELVGGVVYMAAPLRLKHSRYDDEISYLLGTYRRATPGIEVTHNATAILGVESEPQPDLAMRILPEYGGQSRTTATDYLEGAPELVVEIAHSNRALAMHAKREDYRRNGVIEYLVLLVEEQEARWFHFPDDEIRPNREGVSRSRVFPGFWIDVEALLRRDSKRLMEVLARGLDSRPHASFAKRLEAAHRRRGLT